METPKKTGLGSSLLLRRTVNPPVSPAAPLPVTSIQEVMPATEELPSQVITPELTLVPPIQPHRKPSKKSLVLHDRCTLYLEREINKQLGIASRLEGRDRSEIVSDLLQRYLPKYRVEREE